MLATAQAIAIEDFLRLPHHRCGLATAPTIARTKVPLATDSSVDANYVMVAVVVAVSAKAMAAAVVAAVADKDALAIQIAVAELLPAAAVAELLPVAADTKLLPTAVVIAEPLTSAQYAADISAVADAA